MAASKATRLVLQAVASPKPQAGPSPSVGESSTLRSSLCSLGTSPTSSPWCQSPEGCLERAASVFFSVLWPRISHFVKLIKAMKKERIRGHTYTSPTSQSGLQRSLAADSLPYLSTPVVGSPCRAPSRGVWPQTLPYLSTHVAGSPCRTPPEESGCRLSSLHMHSCCGESLSNPCGLCCFSSSKGTWPNRTKLTFLSVSTVRYLQSLRFTLTGHAHQLQ